MPRNIGGHHSFPFIIVITLHRSYSGDWDI